MLKKSSLQAYVTSRISTLENMLQMLSDKQWAMTDIDKQYVLSALQYFAQQDDVIPDNLPVVGLLDDCIVIDIVAEKIKPELEAYIEFVTMAQIYAKDSEYSVNDWLETKRKELFSRMRHRRSRRYKSRRSRGTSFSIV